MARPGLGRTPYGLGMARPGLLWRADGVGGWAPARIRQRAVRHRPRGPARRGSRRTRHGSRPTWRTCRPARDGSPRTPGDAAGADRRTRSRPGSGRTRSRPGSGRTRRNPGGGRTRRNPGGGRTRRNPGGGRTRRNPGGGRTRPRPGRWRTRAPHGGRWTGRSPARTRLLLTMGERRLLTGGQVVPARHGSRAPRGRRAGRWRSRPRGALALMAAGQVGVAVRSAPVGYRSLRRRGRCRTARGEYLRRQRTGRRGGYRRGRLRTAARTAQRGEPAGEPAARLLRGLLDRPDRIDRRPPGRLPGRLGRARRLQGAHRLRRTRRCGRVRGLGAPRRFGLGSPCRRVGVFRRAPPAAPGRRRLVVGTGTEVAAGLPGLAEVGDPAQLIAGDRVPVRARAPLPPPLVRLVRHESSSSVPRTTCRSLGSRSATARSAPCVVGT
jgi:hypothetical protein